MVQTIKKLWAKWQELKTWQQVALLLPLILLTIGILIYILFPIKSKKLDREILKHNKNAVDEHITAILEKEEKLAKKQEDHKTKRLVITEKVKEREKEAENIVKRIDAADDNIDELLSIHESLNARARKRNNI